MTESEKMEIKKLYEEGVRISELARKYGRDRKTIRKALKEPVVKQSSHQGTKLKHSKLEPFKPYIEKQMKKGVMNAVRLLRDIQEQGLYRWHHRSPGIHASVAASCLCQGNCTL